MTEVLKSNSLADLATEVQLKADRYDRSWRSEQLATQLQERRRQLDILIGRVTAIAAQRSIAVEVDPKIRVPKRRLGPAIKKVEKLEASVQIDVSKIVEADALDVTNLEEVLKEIEQTFLDSWQKFVKPPKDLIGTDSLVDVPELTDAVRQLKAFRIQLDGRSKILPSNGDVVLEVRSLQEKIQEISDTLRTHGFDDEVIAFLTQARIAVRGVPLGDVFKKQKIREWIEKGSNASAFVVVHKSLLNRL